uniref:MADS-box protein JOINTLESS-like n=1 Tax=Rhizophora mucronata TaxID=61149 RepID=A0A2P2M541_RHIMU
MEELQHLEGLLVGSLQRVVQTKGERVENEISTLRSKVTLEL